MRHKDFKAEISRKQTPYFPEPIFLLHVIDPDGKGVTITYGELSDALRHVALIFQNTFQVTKVTKEEKVANKNKPGFMDGLVLEALLEHGKRSLRETVEMTGEKVQGRGMASILRSLRNRGFVSSEVEPATGKEVWWVSNPKAVAAWKKNTEGRK